MRPRDPASTPGTETPRTREAERVLGLRPEDLEGEAPGLSRLNVEMVPRARLLGYQALLAVAAAHNALLEIPVGWGLFLGIAVAVEAYALGQLAVLHRLFTRVRSVHLGTVFLAADLVMFSLVLYGTGAAASWLWPLYTLRVADQMWIGRRRAAVMAVAGVGCFLLVMAWSAGVDGAPVDASGVLLKAAILGSLGGYLVLISGLPWDLQGRTQAAREMVLRLETQSKELEAERLRAEQASRAKSDFLARMSHELRTPLNSVVGFTNVLLKPRDPPFPAKDLEYLTRIRDNGAHLMALVNDVLDMALLQEGKVQVRLAPVDLESVVRSTVGQLAPRAEGQPVRLSVSFPRTLGPVHADEARLRQILINLVGNALKFTPEGWVRVEVASDPSTGEPVTLSVADSGVGIPPERQEAVFAAFEQVEGGHARKHGGTGLGLAISRALCRLQGFDLTLRSEPGQGSTFTVHFRPPGREPPSAAPIPSTPSAAAS